VCGFMSSIYFCPKDVRSACFDKYFLAEVKFRKFLFNTILVSGSFLHCEWVDNLALVSV
jgi:hypothetical protein